MSPHHDDSTAPGSTGADPAGHEHDDEHDDEGGTVSEAGSSSLGSDTSLGGADSVPDTPDVNDPLTGGGKDASVAEESPQAD